MANNALKTLLKTDLIELIRSTMSSKNYYYLYVSRSEPYEDNAVTTTLVESDTNPPSIGESSRNIYDVYRNMLFIKRVRPEHMRLIIPRIDWTSGDVYTPYSETTDMAGTDYYVLTTDFNVYKCMGAIGASTIMPTGKSSDVVSLSDGYKWKYLYTVPENDIEYITLDYIPIFVSVEEYAEQKEVQNTAKAGSIDTVSANSNESPTFSKIFSVDRFISNTNRSVIFSELGVTVNAAGSSYISFVPVGEDQNPTNGYWNNYAIHTNAGPGIGQYFRILNFVKGGSGVSYYYANVYPVINRELTDSSVFKIVPYMVVDGDGQDAVVVPVTSIDKKIAGLSIVNPGKNYTHASPRVVTESGSATIGSQVGLFNDSISVSLSTPKGHGYNAVKELGTSDLMIVLELEGNEAGKLSTRNEYRQFGLVKNPFLHGGMTLAGSSEEGVIQATIKRQPTKDDLYGVQTFIPGNHIIGKETRATARIIDSEIIPGSRFHRLYLADVVGDFRFSEDSSNKIRVYFSTGVSAAFATGDTVNQYSGTIGITLSASGTLTSYDYYDRSIVVDTTYGSFAAGKTLTFLGVSGGYTLSPSDMLDLDEEFGEYVGQVDFGSTGDSSFLSFDGDEVFGRLSSTAFVPRPSTEIGEYRLTTKLTLVDSAAVFTDGMISGSNSYDGTITQIDSTTLKKVTADIVDFTVAGGLGFTGIAYLSDVKGSFNTSDQLYFTPYGTTAEIQLNNITINTLESPEIAMGSGEMLYIENIRPVERNIEQSEEFKIVIGF